jgi:carboxypeptidase family protein
MKSWRGPRVIAGLAAATLSLIYFVTLVWGPNKSDEDSGKNYLKELGDQPKGELPANPQDSETDPDSGENGLRNDQPSGDSKVSLEASGLRADELFTMYFEVRDARSQRPLPGATVQVAKAAGTKNVIAEFRVNHDGKGEVRQLPHAQYRYWVEAPGFHTSTPRAIELPVDGKRFKIELEPAAQIVGVFEGRDGKARSHGVLHMTKKDSSEVLLVRADKNGRFASPPLQDGDWTLAWMSHSHAQPEREMIAQLSLPAGQRTLLEVVIPEGTADLRSKRTAGIRLAVERLQ